MPVRSFNPEQLSKKEMVSLDYDGIRLVYPNTTFGPGFGHAIEGIPKTQESDEAFYQNILSDIGKGPYSIFKALSTEDRKEFIAYYQMQLHEYKNMNLDHEHSIQDHGTEQDHEIQHNFEKTIYDTDAMIFQEPVDLKLQGANYSITEKKMIDYHRLHDTLFKDTPECKQALEHVIDSIKSVDGVVDFVIMTYNHLHQESTDSERKKDFLHFISNNVKIIHYTLKAMLSYVQIIQDYKIDDVSLIMKNYLQDITDDIQDETSLYKSMNVCMHCLNLLKTILQLISVRYKNVVIITNSDICTFVESYKELFLQIFTRKFIDESKYFKNNWVSNILNMEVVCHIIYKVNKKHYLVDYNNMKSEMVDDKVQIEQLKKKMQAMENEPSTDVNHEPFKGLYHKLQMKQLNLVKRVQELSEKLKKMEDGGIRRKIHGIKLSYRSNFYNNMAKHFFYCLSVYRSQFPDYNDFKSEKVIPLSSEKQITMGRSFIDGTSNELLFTSYNNSLLDAINFFRESILYCYHKIILESKIYFMTQVNKLFVDNPNKGLFQQKYTIFTKENILPPPEEPTYAPEFHDDLRFLMTHPDEFIQYVTSTENIQTLQEFNYDMQMWLSWDKYNFVQDMIKRQMACVQLIAECMQPLTQIKDDQITMKKTDMYLVCISHLKINKFTGVEENAHFFMKRLCYTIKYKYFAKIFNPIKNLKDKEEVITPLHKLRNKYSDVDVDKFLDSLHLHSYAYQQKYNVTTPIAEREFKIYIAIEKRSDLLLFFDVMHEKTLSNHTLDDGRKGNTYKLRWREGDDADEFDPNVFYMVDEVKRMDEIQIDLVLEKGIPTNPSQKMVAKKIKANKLSYETFKSFENTLKSFSIFLTNYYNLPMVDKDIKTQDIALWRKQANYSALFLTDIAKTLLRDQSMFLFDNDREHNWDYFKKVLIHMLNIVHKFKKNIHRHDYKSVRPNSEHLQRLQVMIYFTYRNLSRDYHLRIFRFAALPDTHYLIKCQNLQDENNELAFKKSKKERSDDSLDYLKPKACTHRTLPDYYKACMDFAIEYF